MDYNSSGCPGSGVPRSGARNARRVRSERRGGLLRSTPSSSPNPTLCEDPLSGLPNIPVTSSAPGCGNPGVWECLLCDRQVPVISKREHLESYIHLQNEESQKEVTDKAQGRIEQKRTRKDKSEEKLVELMKKIRELQEEAQEKKRLGGLLKQEKEEGVRGIEQKLGEKKFEERTQQKTKGEERRKASENRTESAQKRGQNHASEKYQQPVKDVTPWECDVCEMAMKTHLKSYHIASSLHRHNANQQKDKEGEKEQSIVGKRLNKAEGRREKMRLEEEETMKQQERKIEGQRIVEEERIAEERRIAGLKRIEEESRIAEEKSVEERRKEEERQKEERLISEAKRIQDAQEEEEKRREDEAEKGIRKENERQRLRDSQFEDEVEISPKVNKIEQQEKPITEQRRVTEPPEKDDRMKMLQYLLSQGHLQEESAEQDTKRVWTHEEMYLEYTEKVSQEYMSQEQAIWAQGLASPLPLPVSHVVDLPPVLYRVYDETSVSQYTIAGFNSGNPYLPNNPSKFKSMVKRHANWSSRGGTPFISVTTSPDAVGWHVAKKKAVGGYGNVMVALIDTATLLTTCRSQIWKMHDAMDHFDLEPYKCQRRAYDNEYICALRIPAIAIFACCQPDYFMDVALIFLKNLDSKR